MQRTTDRMCGQVQSGPHVVRDGQACNGWLFRALGIKMQRHMALLVCSPKRCERRLLCQMRPVSLTGEDTVLYRRGIFPPETTLVLSLNTTNCDKQKQDAPSH